jgi:peroxiredoxin
VGLGDALRAFRTQHGGTLAELSARTPLLVVFLRHFGCTFCRETLADIRARRGLIESAGVRIVIAHMMEDNGDTAAEFARYGLEDVDRVSDPGRSLYRAFDLHRGTVLELLAPKVWFRGLIALLRGHGAGALRGDGRQMPGTFIVHRGRIVKAFRHRTAADRPDYAAMACETRPS